MNQAERETSSSEPSGAASPTSSGRRTLPNASGLPGFMPIDHRSSRPSAITAGRRAAEPFDLHQEGRALDSVF